METIVKFDYKKMKADIKAMAEEQLFLKNQKKTKKIIGERKIEASTAASRHQMNKANMRIMYAAYGIARGKSFSQIENHYLEDNHPLKNYQRSIDRILKSYEVKLNIELPVE